MSVYVVHFTQAEAAQSAQDFTSINVCSRDENIYEGKNVFLRRSVKMTTRWVVRERKPNLPLRTCRRSRVQRKPRLQENRADDRRFLHAFATSVVVATNR